jgi:hypothetical protein
VEAYHARSELGVAKDTFLVVGSFDCADLARAIGGVPVETWRLPFAVRIGVRVAVTGAVLAAAPAVAVSRVLRRTTAKPPR